MSWAELFEPHGWKNVGKGTWSVNGRSGTYEKLRRPGKDHGHSATVRFGGDWFHVFTDQTPFKQGETYTKFGVYAVLNHGGDFSKAAQALRAQGFGAPSPNGPVAQPSSAQSAPSSAQSVPSPPQIGPRVLKRRLITCRASTIQPRNVDWFCQDRIPRGMPTMLTGDQKLGKSLVLIYYTACATRGWGIHGENATCPPGSVVLLVGEDHLECTVIPRLLAAGADMDKIDIVTATESAGVAHWPNLKTDCEALEDVIKAQGDTLLCGIDPVTAYLEGVDDYKASALRPVLMPLGKVAERQNVAMVLVNHVGKAVTLNAAHRGLGSVAYGGTARLNYLVAPDPDDPSGRRRSWPTTEAISAPRQPRWRTRSNLA
jgi:hypothetical protein